MLDAALELFSKKGYHRVTMQEIAKKAEFAVGTLYKFFINKETLYRVLMLGLSDQFDDLINQALGGAHDEVEITPGLVSIDYLMPQLKIIWRTL